MRITGGIARGIQLKVPKGNATRPATDRMREAIFSSLGSSVAGSRVADLFAGTGSYGLEALSRGATSVIFCETDRAALACLKHNQQAVLKCCKLSQSCISTVTRDVYALNGPNNSYDLIFIDPPYDAIESNLACIFTTAEVLATTNARLILELPGNLTPDIAGWQLTRRFGKPRRDTPNAAIFERVIA